MKSAIIAVVFLWLVSPGSPAQVPFDESLMTVPERTAYARTSTHAEVLQSIDNLMRGSDLVHRETMLVTRDGRDVPLLIVSDPPISTPAEAQSSGKPVIYIQGNIHGGEVEGKEAILILLRDILHGDKAHLLANQILALAPIYNADGNDQHGQNGTQPLASYGAQSHFDVLNDQLSVAVVHGAGSRWRKVVIWTWFLP